MNPFDHELRDTMKSLGKQVEAQVPPELYQVARLVGSGTAASAPVRRPRIRIGKVVEVAAACLLLGSLVGVAAYRNLSGAGVESKADACGYRQTIGENLALAAQTLPVPSASISLREEPARKATWPAEWETVFRQAQEQQRLGYRLDGNEVHLSTWGGPSQKDPGFGFSDYRFPRGDLSEQSNLAQIFAQFQVAAAAGDMNSTAAVTMVRQVTAEEYYRGRITGRYWTLKDVLRWYDADMARPACVTKTIPEFHDGPIVQIALPMLDLHNGWYVGFRGDKLITLADNEGLFGGGTETNWYTVPGLLPTDKLSGKPARTPVQSKAQLKQAEAARKAKEPELAALKTEVAKAEADYAAILVPKLEDVGEAAYTKAAEASAAQGLRMKELQVRLGRLQQEVNDPLSDEVKLEKAIEYHRLVLTTPGEVAPTGDPKIDAYRELKQRQVAGLNRIEHDFKSGSKPPKALLAELESLLNP